MDAVLPMFLVAAVLELGERTQALVALLAARYHKKLPVLLGVLLAAAILSGIAGFGGALVAAAINHRAVTLLLGLALVSGGAGGLMTPKPPEPIAGWRLGAFLSSAGAFLILAAGDQTMFATLAFAAHDGAPVFTAAAATMGVLAASILTVVAGNRMPAKPLRIVRGVLGTSLIAAGLYVVVGALDLI